MLKASSSGIVRVVLRKRLYEYGLLPLLAGTGIRKQRVIVIPSLTLPFLCPLHPFCMQTRAASSSRFASRFFGPQGDTTSPIMDGETAITATDEGGGTEKGAIHPGLTATTRDGEPVRGMRYHYLPWAHVPLSTAHAAEHEGEGRGQSKQIGRTIKQSGKSGKSKVRSTSEKWREVVATKAWARRKRKRDGLRLKETETVDSVEDAICDAVESKDFWVPGDGLEEQEHDSDSYESINLEDLQVEDLSAEQLRAIILNKNSDLMGLVWDAYHQLITLEAGDAYHDKNTQEAAEHDGNSLVGPDLLTALANRLVARRKHHRKDCREIFLRLLSVYARLRRERAASDGVPYLRTAEWNCLIHFAGTGLRGKASLEAYNASLDVYYDMLRGMEEARAARSESFLPEIEPNIYTYTSLLNIALQTEHQPAIDHAMKLLRDSGMEPTRVTHLCMIRYRYRVEGLSGVRALLSSMKSEDIGMDGVSAYMVCAGDEGDLDVVKGIYNTMRRNIEAHEDGTFGPGPRSSNEKASESGISERATDDAEEYITVEGIRLSRSFVPSAAIYNYVIQIFAYYGRLSDALEVFMDMLRTRQPPRPPRSPHRNSREEGMGFYQPSYEAFRGLFLGFSRHACRTDKSFSLPTSTTNSDSSDTDTTTTPLTQLFQRPEWNWERFSVILEAFLEYGDISESQTSHYSHLHHQGKDQQGQENDLKRGMHPPSERMVFWIMTAARRLTGGNEVILRDVWRRLNERWCIRKGGRLKGLDAKYGNGGLSERDKERE